MTIEELNNKIERLSLEVDKLSKMKNVSTNEIESLVSKNKASQSMLNERYRIDSNLMVCKIITGTTHASAGTESTHPHLLGRTPNVVLVLPNANATIYKSKASDKTNFYLKSSGSATAFTAFVLY